MTKDPSMSNNLERNACTKHGKLSAVNSGKARHLRCSEKGVPGAAVLE